MESRAERRRESIQRSGRERDGREWLPDPSPAPLRGATSPSRGEVGADSRMPIANLAAFQSLLQKLRPASNLGLVFLPLAGSLTTGRRTSCVCVAIWAMVKRM